MEPPAKKPRLGGGTRGDTTSSEASHYYHNSSRPSNRFEGYGVQNTGNFTISGDLTMHINERPNTSTGVNKHQALLDSLHFDQMDARQLTIKKAYAHTCAWFLKSPPYLDWAKKKSTMCHDHNFLWIKGKPGAGKSTLMKFLLGKLRNQIRQAGNQEILISFFFNARGDDLEKTTTGMYRSLLLQLLEKRPDLRYVLDSIRIGHVWTTASLKSLFEEVLQGLGDTSLLCLVDALDECEEAQIRDMVTFLSDPGVIPNRFRICFASRHYPHITLNTGLSIILENQTGHSRDIESYLRSALVIEDGSLAEKIRCDLQEKASGVFMWVVLVVDILNKEYDAGREHVLRERIKQLPGDLHDLFLDILTRDDNNMDGLLLCIQWVLFSRHPLTPKQLYFAMLSGLEPDKLPYCHSGDIISEDSIKRYILNNSKGLTEYTVAKSPVIQFIHESVRDFLLKENGLCRIWAGLSTNVFGLSHNMLKKCCETYMSIKEVTDEKETSSREVVALRFPFLEYAHREILYHADQAQSYNICQHDFLVEFRRSKWVKHHNIFTKEKVRLYTPKVSLFYILSEAGMAALIRAQPNCQSCYEVEDERYGLPVLAASAAKSRETIQAMLELETERLSETCLAKLHSMMPPNLDISFASGRNYKFSRKRDLLHQLVEYGNEKAAVFFLAVVGCDIHAKNPQGDSILISAVERNFCVLVEALLRCGADMLATSRGRLTALSMALSRRQTEISKLLIEGGADISATTKEGDLLLHSAARGGLIEITQLLIDRGANVLGASIWGLTALHSALYDKKTEISKLLIEGGADVSAINELGDTPLYLAARGDLIEITQLLIDHGADILATSSGGLTALHMAISRGQTEISKLLIEGGADVSANTEEGDSPLHFAAKGDLIEIAQLLINRGADVSATNNYGRSPLHGAIWERHIEAAKLLINHGANLSANDTKGLSPLYLALDRRLVEVPELLIDRGADISAVTTAGESLLHKAIFLNNTEAAQLLIDRGADISTTNVFGRSPLQTAMSYSYIGAAKLLIERGADLSAADDHGETVLAWALRLAPYRQELTEVVEILLKHGAKG